MLAGLQFLWWLLSDTPQSQIRSSVLRNSEVSSEQIEVEVTTGHVRIDGATGSTVVATVDGSLSKQFSVDKQETHAEVTQEMVGLTYSVLN